MSMDKYKSIASRFYLYSVQTSNFAT